MNMLVVTLAFIFAMFPPKVKNFSGRWELDAKKSTNLPKSFEKVESYTMDVRQTPDSLVLVVELRGAGGDQPVKFPVTIYLLNGKEVYREDTARSSKRWMTCSFASNGSALVVNTKVELGSGEKKKEFTQRDEWRMKDASTVEISVSQNFAKSDSTHNELRVFHKMK